MNGESATKAFRKFQRREDSRLEKGPFQLRAYWSLSGAAQLFFSSYSLCFITRFHCIYPIHIRLYGLEQWFLEIQLFCYLKKIRSLPDVIRANCNLLSLCVLLKLMLKLLLNFWCTRKMSNDPKLHVLLAYRWQLAETV